MNLKDIIFRQGKRQIQVAFVIGWNPSAFCKYVNGWITIPEKYVQKLCDEIGIPTERLKSIRRGQ